MNKQELIEKLREHGAWCTECHDINGKKDRYVKAAKVRELLDRLDEPQKVRAKLAEHWDEDMGDVLWWDFPVEEPPYCGTPLDEYFPKYKTHFTTIDMPNEIEKPKQWVVKMSNGKYFASLAYGIGSHAECYAKKKEAAYQFADRAKAEAVALLVDGSVEEV